ncbi:MAG: hypothetical protein AAF362_08000 [Pseudomonadota bacterium]
MRFEFPDRKELVDGILVIFLVGLALLPAALFVLTGYKSENLLDEDGLYEGLAAIACGLTALFLVYKAFYLGQSGKLVLFWTLFLAFSLFFIGGEEISWGQRLIGFDTPQIIRENNFQEEFNLHNSTLIQSSNNALSVILTQLLVAYLLVFPLVVHAFPTARSITDYIRIPVPPLAVALVAITAKLISTQTYRLIYGTTETADVFSLGEAFETVLELCLCWVAVRYVNDAPSVRSKGASNR